MAVLTDCNEMNFIELDYRVIAYDTVKRELVPSTELDEWLEENVLHGWRMGEHMRVAGIRFENERDFVLFKMWWC